MPKITEVFCYVVSDTSDDDEGVPAIQRGGMLLPLMGADIMRTGCLREAAQQVADEQGKEVRLYRFSCKEQVDVIEPRTRPAGKRWPDLTPDEAKRLMAMMEAQTRHGETCGPDCPSDCMFRGGN